MRPFLLLLAAVTVLGACGKRNVSSAGLVGSFVREDALAPGLVTRLHVTPSGMTVTTPTLSVGTAGSIEVAGKPLVKGSTKAEVGFAAQGAALFARVRCDEERACAFTTTNGCEGTLSGDAKGNLVLIATGECGAWSGRWLAEKDQPPPATARPAPPEPSATASVAPAPADKMGCMSACNDAQTRCALGCKLGDTGCMQACSSRTMECIQRCP